MDELYLIQKKMRIAILGAGFAGLSTAWHLLHHTQAAISIDLYDSQAIGTGISGLSSGLLHAYAGKHARKVWKADEGIDATHRLLTESSRALNAPIILSKGILRPATVDEQVSDFQMCAEKNRDTEWWDEEKCLSTVKGLRVKEGGLYIKNGLTIDVPFYLKGLWQACALLGTQFHQLALFDEEKLKKYDRVVFALGYAMTSFPIFAKIPIKPVKGQILEVRWPENLPPLPFSLVSHGYLVMGKERTCILGATFEREFATKDPDLLLAKKLIMEKILPFFPDLETAEIVSCKAGIRAAAPAHNHLPLIGSFQDKYWYVTGLGSKGLLYHGWLGDLLAKALLSGNGRVVPPEVWFPL